MARKHGQFLLLAAFLIVASCSAYNAVQIIETNENLMHEDILDVQTTKDDFQYHVNNKRGVPCILANMAIKITVPYKTENGTDLPGSLKVPADEKPTGTCSDAKSEMTFTWKEKKDEKAKDNVVTFTFINDYTNFSLYSITAHIYLDNMSFPNITEKDENREKDWFSGNDLRLFVAPVKTGLHKCDNKTIKIGDIEFEIANISVIAFNKVNDYSMRKDKQCSKTENKTDTFPYFLKNDKNESCILAKMDVSFTIPYSTKDSGVKQGIKSIPSERKVTGKCGKVQTTMTITWPESTKEQSAFASENTENSVSIVFVKDEQTFVSGITYDIYADSKNFPGSTSTRLRDRSPVTFQELIAPENGLYSCANKVISLENSVMNVSNLLLVAYDAESDFSKKTAVDCKSELSPKVQDFKYVVRNSDGVPCTLVSMNITIDVQYEAKDKNDSKPISVPSPLNGTGLCEKSASTMRLDWSTGSTKRSILFYIRRNSTTFFVYQIEAEISLNKEDFPDAIEQDTILSGESGDSEKLFAANAVNGMYNCTKEQFAIPMSGGLKMTISNVTFIAFNDDDDLSMRQDEGCPKEPETTTTTTTTTTEPPTEPPTEPTTLAPEPDPSVKKYTYYVMKTGTDIACIIANMTISLRISYDKSSSGTNVKTLTVPKDSKVGGSCDNATSRMELIWQEKTDATYDTVDSRNIVTLTFQRTDSRFSLHSINVSWYMDEKNFQDAKQAKQRAEAFSKDANVFTSSVSKLYKCAPKTTKKVERVDVTISEMSLIAFNTEKIVTTRAVESCETEESGSDTGAIVGGIIGGLILAGLLGYGVMWYLKRRRPT